MRETLLDGAGDNGAVRKGEKLGDNGATRKGEKRGKVKKAKMEPRNFMLAATALAATLMVAFFNVARTQGQTPTNDAHKAQIYGTVQTGNMATTNQSRLADVTIVVRNAKRGKLGKIVGFSPIKDGKYAVDMADLPAGKYVVEVDPGASYYMQGERLVDQGERAVRSRTGHYLPANRRFLHSNSA